MFRLTATSAIAKTYSLLMVISSTLLFSIDSNAKFTDLANLRDSIGIQATPRFNNIAKALEYKRKLLFEGKDSAKAYLDAYRKASFLIDVEGSSIQFSNASNTMFAEIGGYLETATSTSTVTNGYLSFKTKKGGTFTENMSLSSSGLLTAAAFKASSPLPDGDRLSTDNVITIDADGYFKKVSLSSFTTGSVNAPNYPLDIIANNTEIFRATQYSTNYGANFLQRRARGTSSNPAAVIKNDLSGGIIGSAYDGTNFQNLGRIAFYVDSTVSANNMPGRIVFNTTSFGSATEQTRMTIKNNGFVGINTPSPSGRLNVVSEDTETSYFDLYSNLSYMGPGYVARKARGTYANPLAVQNGDVIAGVWGGGYNGSSFNGSGAAIRFLASENFTSTTNNGTEISLETTLNGYNSRQTRLFIKNNGNTGIGTTNPIGKLHISDGNIVSSNLAGTSDYNIVSAENSAPGYSAISASAASAGYRGVFKGIRVRGTLANPTAIAQGDYTVSLLGAGHDGIGVYGTAGINFFADAPVSAGNVPQGIMFETGQTTTRTERMRISSSGTIGINNNAPEARLHLIAEDGEQNVMIDAINNLTTSGAGVVVRRARGTKTAKQAVLAGDVLGGMVAAPYNGNIYNNNNSAIRFFATENAISATANGSSLTLETTLNGTNTRQIRMRVENDGKIGINTSLTEARLHIKSEGLEAASLAESYSDVANISAGHLLRKSRGTIASPAAVQNGDAIGGLFAAPFNGSGFNGNSAALRYYASGSITPTSNGSYITLETTPNGSITRAVRMRIDNDGKIGIGTETPSQKLEVAGVGKFTDGLIATLPSSGETDVIVTIDALTGVLHRSTSTMSSLMGESMGKSIHKFNSDLSIGNITPTDTSFNLFVEKGILTRKVTVNPNKWADYVFNTDYKLRSLTDLETFINKNKHLPDVPTAETVAKEGVNVGDNQAVLLKKIEELTLYIIELNKKNEELNKRLQTVEKNIKN